MSSESLFFGECANLVRASISPSLFPDSPYIALEHIDQGMLSLNGHAFGRDADSQKTKFSKGDILFGKLRPYFRKAVIAPFDGMCSTDIWVVRPKLGIDRNFLFYWMASEEFVNHATDTSEGTRMPRAKWDIVSKFEILERSIDEQRAIGNLLRALDDRIALLRETNATLEAIAQAIFKSWFVDFDPVHAKAEGRLPEGMDEETAALFPDGFEESALGLIPRGWKVMSLGDLLVPKRGTSITKSKCIDGDIPVVAGGLEPAYFHNQGNVCSPVVTISASGANAGFVRLYQQDIWASDCSFVSAGQTDATFFWYVFLKFNQEKIYSMQQGAAQPHVYPSDLMRLSISSPKPCVMRNIFNELVSPLFEHIGLAHSKIKTLTDLRDTLLPRLISGKLRLPECQNGIEQTTA